MKWTQIAGLIVVLIIIGGLITAKFSRAKDSDESEAQITTVPLPPPDARDEREKEEVDPLEYYAGYPSGEDGEADVPEESDAIPEPDNASKPLPKMLELGSVGCLPCDIMEPIIAALKSELRAKVDIEFIDVAKHPEVAEEHRIMTIPTQVFLDADGNELDRHIGVYEKEDILANMRKLGMIE